MSSVYARSLPPPAISLFSKRGNKLFDESRMAATAVGSLNIMSRLQTQRELTSCGLASLATILNALQIDPQRKWKGRWRWYDETMLVDDKMLNKVKVQGLAFSQLIDIVPKDKVNLQAFFTTNSSLTEFREQVLKATSSSTSAVLVGYSRKVLGQTGADHYSPIAAYNDANDAVLVMDVARFKYDPHWIPCSILWGAMSEINQKTGKSRGFMVISKPGDLEY